MGSDISDIQIRGSRICTLRMNKTVAETIGCRSFL